MSETAEQKEKNLILAYLLFFFPCLASTWIRGFDCEKRLAGKNECTYEGKEGLPEAHLKYFFYLCLLEQI